MPTFIIDEDAPILVELMPPTGLEQVSLSSLSPEEIAKRSAKALDSAMSTIHHMARRVSTMIGALCARPTQVEVAFGLKLDAESGAVIAKAGMEASINVKLTWKETNHQG